MPCTTLNLIQGTSAWLAWRDGGIGGSDAPAIMGENPWKSRCRLLDEKCGTVGGGASNAAMDRGVRLEPEARRLFQQATGLMVETACVQSRAHSWLRASLDGLDAAAGRVVEIKCGDGVYAHAARRRQVPRYYVGQLQHILAVTGLASIDFWCWLPGMPEVHLRVPRDDAYIARLLEAEQAFWLEVERHPCTRVLRARALSPCCDPPERNARCR